jgi:beta-mannosidase
MTAAAALRASGDWDPRHPRDFDADDWWYRCRIAIDLPPPVRLRFEGLASIADVWLNGRLILHSDNMFVGGSVSVEEDLPAGSELVFCFHALRPLLEARHRRPRWRTRLVRHQALRWYRTSLLGRIQSWCPPVAPVGPWRAVRIERGPLFVERADVRADVDGERGLVRVLLLGTCESPVGAEATITVGDCTGPLTYAPTSDGRFTLAGVVPIGRVERWWPHTHGDQRLYDVRANLAVDGRLATIELGRVGFRTLQVDPGVDGDGFTIVINGTPIFIRGACWTPLDLVALRARGDDYRVALDQLCGAGMNMIRIGGTMTYEADELHDLCDELGILVWQDLMFANMDYPFEDEAFARSVEHETTQLLAGLESRPSLAVVCGGSEVDQQAAMLGLRPSEPGAGSGADRLRMNVRALAPGAAYLPSTPSGGAFPFQVNAGVSHYYGVGAYRRPFDDARRAGVRFAAECLAFSNVPDARTIDAALDEGEMPGHHPRWKAAVPRDPGSGWDFEDVRDHYVERLFGVAPAELRARDPERYLTLGRVATGEAMLRTFAEWRRPGSTCSGGLVWFARDFVPGAGWGIVDASGRPKASYWYLKRALAPVALLAADEGLNGLWFHAINDTAAAIEVELRIALYRHGEPYHTPAFAALTVAARGHQSIHADALFGQFLDLTYAYRFGPPGHDVIAATLRDPVTGALLASACYYPGRLPADPLLDVGLSARAEPAAGGSITLVLEAERFAHSVAIDLEQGVPDDNYLHLEPHEPRQITVRRTEIGSPLRGTVAALNDPRAVPFIVVEAANAR